MKRTFRITLLLAMLVCLLPNPLISNDFPGDNPGVINEKFWAMLRKVQYGFCNCCGWLDWEKRCIISRKNILHITFRNRARTQNRQIMDHSRLAGIWKNE